MVGWSNPIACSSLIPKQWAKIPVNTSSRWNSGKLHIWSNIRSAARRPIIKLEP